MAGVEASLGCVAVIAAGLPGHGPWKLVSARYDRIHPAVATLQLGSLGQRLVMGAVFMTEADVFAKSLIAAGEKIARDGAKLEPPWFLYDEANLATLLKRAALAANIKAMSYEHYVARVEAQVARELS